MGGPRSPPGRQGRTPRERRCLHPQHCHHHGQGAAQRGGPPPTPGDLRPPPARRDQRPHQRAAQHWYDRLACLMSSWLIHLCSAFKGTLRNCNFTNSSRQCVKIAADCFINVHFDFLCQPLAMCLSGPIKLCSFRFTLLVVEFPV